MLFIRNTLLQLVSKSLKTIFSARVVVQIVEHEQRSGLSPQHFWCVPGIQINIHILTYILGIYADTMSKKVGVETNFLLLEIESQANFMIVVMFWECERGLGSYLMVLKADSLRLSSGHRTICRARDRTQVNCVCKAIMLPESLALRLTVCVCVCVCVYEWVCLSSTLANFRNRILALFLQRTLLIERGLIQQG